MGQLNIQQKSELQDQSSNQSSSEELQPWFEFICGRCMRNCSVRGYKDSQGELVVKGNGCHRGLDLGHIESRRKRHAIRTRVRIAGSERYLPVKLTRKIDDDKSVAVMKKILSLEVVPPLKKKQVLVEAIEGTSADLLALEKVE